jgi:hypothetical protein
MEVRPYTPDLEPVVKAFNLRLRAGGEAYWSLPESYIPRFPKLPDVNPYQELFVILDQKEVHGGYLLTHSQFSIHGETKWICCGPQLSISEGIVNHSYKAIGVLNLRDALKRQPLLYGLGIGGFNEPQARLLAAMKWPLRPVPFFFKVLNPSRFFANIEHLRKRQNLRLLLDLARYCGVGWAAVQIAQWRPWTQNGSTAPEIIPEFGRWADELWNKCKNSYSLIALRDTLTLNRLYPPSDPRFLRLKISRKDELLGWAVVLDTQMSRHKQFGSMRVGSMVDCLAEPEHAAAVVQHSTTFLEQRGVDLIVSNQVSSAWGKAFLSAGYLQGPTNFILALSPLLAGRLEPLEGSLEKIHMNRGDGDGPIHL